MRYKMSNEEKRPLKLALVGLGTFPFNVQYPMLRNEAVELKAVCDIDEAKCERFARFYNVPARYADYKDMIRMEKPDAVICVVNADVHYEAAKFCLENGVHVWVEKTPCNTAAQAEELAALQKKSGKFAGVGFNCRFITSYVMANEIIHRPEFGEISMFYSKFNASPYKSNDFFIFSHIIHHLDLARYLLGEIGDLHVQKKIKDDKRGAFAVHFTALESGAIGTIQAASGLYEAYPCERLDIAGFGGANLVVDNLRDLRYNRSGPRRDNRDVPPLDSNGDCVCWNFNHRYGVSHGIYSYAGFEGEIYDFLDSIRDGKRPLCTIEESIGSMKAMEIVRKVLG
jgi:predicted dehydrogenase